MNRKHGSKRGALENHRLKMLQTFSIFSFR